VKIELPPPTYSPSARQTVELLGQFVDLGAAHVMLDFGGVTEPRVVQRIGLDVLAHFK
jgi:hypothetical protein